MKLDGREELRLKWPEGWPRTRLQDRQARSAWKRNFADSRDGLLKELVRLGATSYLLTRNESNSDELRRR